MSETHAGYRPKAKIQPHNGVPTLFLDGQPAPAFAYMTFNLQKRLVAAFAEAGVELFTFSTTSDYDYYRFSADAWLGPDQYDYAQFDERMRLILDAAPKARVFPRVYLCSPPWWDEAHPGELMAGEGGAYDPPADFGWLPSSVSEESLKPEKMTVPSFSSEAWLREGGAALQRFLCWSEERYGHCTIGYHLCSGGSQEWYYWGAFEDLFPDTSAPQQRAFRRWLARRGRADAEGCSVPDAAARKRAELGLFRDPGDPQAALAIDYWRFHAEALVDALGHFARLAREAIGPDKLLGAFYGYFVDLCRHPTCWHNSGHLALQKLLADPNVDFVASPTAYRNRAVGRGFSLFNSLTASVAHHGKLWWNENDILTHRAPELKDPLFLHPKTEIESRHLQRREFANVLCHGVGTWWFDMWGGYYDDARTMADVRRMMAIARRAVHCDRSAVDEFAVVLDDESVHYTECSNRLTVPLVADQLIELGHMGLPFSVVHVDDLPALRRRRFLLFLDLFHATDERIRAVREVALAPGTTSLFVYAPGLVGETLSPGRMERLTGLRLRLDPEPAPLRVTVPPGIRYGTTEALAPVVFADDPGAEELGWLSGTSRPGLVRKSVGGATVLFSAAPRLPAALLRRLARDAGAHVYTDGGETVYASRSFLAICAPPGQPVRLSLPAGGVLYDLFGEREQKVAAESTSLAASEDGTLVFYRGSRSQWESVGKGQ